MCPRLYYGLHFVILWIFGVEHAYFASNFVKFEQFKVLITTLDTFLKLRVNVA